MGHVVPITDIGKLQAFESSLLLINGKKVSESLAGMGKVREAINHRDFRILHQIEDGLMAKDPRHDAVDIAGEDLGRIADVSPRPSWRSVELR